MAQKAYDSTREDYKTPTWIVNKLLEIANTQYFSMDVCCSEENIPARFNVINGLYDGLAIMWYGKCFLNPPFKQARYWLHKAFKEIQEGNAEEVYMVLPADRLETNYYQELIILLRMLGVRYTYSCNPLSLRDKHIICYISLLLLCRNH